MNYCLSAIKGELKDNMSKKKILTCSIFASPYYLIRWANVMINLIQDTGWAGFVEL